MGPPIQSVSADVLRQPFPQLRPAPSARHVSNGNGYSFFLANEHDQLLAASDASVKQISLQHWVMLGLNRDHYGRVFRPLALVNGRCIGRDQGVEFAEG